MESRKQFTFRYEYYEAIQQLPPRCRLQLYEAICEYALRQRELPLKGSAKATFILIKDKLDADIRKSEEGRRCSEYKQWRKDVFTRDNYTCRKCGEYGCRLNAHHIKQYAYFPDYRYDVDNGITLCEPCHRAIHRKRGAK